MKDFMTWLEGFGIDYSQIPQQASDQYWLFNQQTNLKKDAIDALHDSPFLRFSNTDDPTTDLIQIEPLNQAQQLPVLSLKDQQLLPSFEGCTIHYGFRFSIPKQPKEDQASRFNRLPPGAEETLRKLETDKKKLEKELPLATNLSKVLKSIIDQEYAAFKGKAYSDIVDKVVQNVNIELKHQNFVRRGKLVQLTPEVVLTYLRNVEKEKDVLRQDTIKKKIAEIDQEIEAVKTKTPFYNVTQQAMLRKLKFPRTPQDKELQNQFVRLAAENYYRIKQQIKYDYVVYPESRSNLNAEIATALAERFHAWPIQGLNKLPSPDEDWTLAHPGNSWRIDTHSLGDKHPSMDKPTWRQRLFNLADRIKSGRGQIKNIPYDTPFVRNWQMSPTLNQQLDPRHARSGLRGRTILLIDDNVRTSGTFQAVYHIIIKTKPRRIDIYTPLWVDFTY